MVLQTTCYASNILEWQNILVTDYMELVGESEVVKEIVLIGLVSKRLRSGVLVVMASRLVILLGGIMSHTLFH